MSDRCALITGVLGQDGRLTARLLAERGYRVVGTTRGKPQDVADPPSGVELHQLNLGSAEQVADLVSDERPTEIYNYAAYSTGQGLFDDPLAMIDVNGVAVVRFLDAITRVDSRIRFFQAGSSEVYGYGSAPPQNEHTPFSPRSPYGAAKLFAQTMVGIYRRHHGLFACTGIMFNHESTLRPPAFVTRKVTMAAARAGWGMDGSVRLGDLQSRRDWGYAGDTVAAAVAMLGAATPSDYVIATGTQHSVEDLCRLAYGRVGLDYRDFVLTDPRLVRPEAAVNLVGDAGAIREALGWRPCIAFPELVATMVDHDYALLRQSVMPISEHRNVPTN